MNVLITSISFKVQLAKAFKKAGWTVYTHDCSNINSELYSSFNHFISPRTDDLGYKDFLLKFCEKYKIDLLVPTRDDELKLFHQIKQILEFGGTKVLVSEQHYNITNKQFMLMITKQNDIMDIPKTYSSDTLIEHFQYPIFIKPIYGQGSKDLFTINNQYEYSQWILSHDKYNYIIQEYLDPLEWTEYSIDVLYNFESILIGGIPRKRQLIRNGESQITTINLIQDLIQDLNKKLELLGEKFLLIGHNVIQVFINEKEKEIKMIEINPRFGGASNLAIQGGLDSPKILMMMFLEFSIENLRKQFKPIQGLKMIRHTFDRFYLNDQNYFSNEPKIFCFDLDGTICSEKGINYETEVVYPRIRDKIQNLYNQGNHIIVYTARGAKSGTDWKPLVKKQLQLWKVPYHEIIDKKPFADYYIDNKGIDILDF